MVKEFRIELAPPPQLGYVVNSDVTGHVLLVTDEAKSGYKAIEITLKGYGNVRWPDRIARFGSRSATIGSFFFSLIKTVIQRLALLSMFCIGNRPASCRSCSMTGNNCENLCFSSGSREGIKADSIGHNIIVLRDKLRGSLFSS